MISDMVFLGCHCDRDGSVRDDCDDMTGQCTCKDGVTGTKCSVCEDGGILTSYGCVDGMSHKLRVYSCFAIYFIFVISLCLLLSDRYPSISLFCKLELLQI